MFPFNLLFSLNSIDTTVASIMEGFTCPPASAVPFCSFSSAMAFQSFSALWGFTKVPQYIEGFFHHSVLHWSITHPLSPALSHSQSFILTSSRFDSTICLFTPALIHSESSSSVLSLLFQMKAAISSPSRDRKRSNFLLVSAACKAVVSFQTDRPRVMFWGVWKKLTRRCFKL